MKVLTFADGRSFNATDSSTITSLHTVLTSFSAVDAEWSKFTVENLVSCEFDGVQYRDIIPVGVSAAKDGNNVSVTITTRMLTQDEINARQADLIAELQEAIAELG